MPFTKGLTVRQHRYKKNRLLGMTRMDAGIAAGYSESYMRTQSKHVENIVKSSIVDELNRSGATDQEISRDLYNIAKGAVKDNGKPDYHCRRETWKLIAQLKKQLSSQPIIDQSSHTHLTIVRKDEKNRIGING